METGSCGVEYPETGRTGDDLDAGLVNMSPLQVVYGLSLWGFSPKGKSDRLSSLDPLESVGI